MNDDDEVTLEKRLARLQYRMALIVFRPVRVIRACWRNGRQTINSYIIAFIVLLSSALGLGGVIYRIMSGSEYFLLSAERTFTRQFGEVLLVIWVLGLNYLLAIGVTIVFMGWFRQRPNSE